MLKREMFKADLMGWLFKNGFYDITDIKLSSDFGYELDLKEIYIGLVEYEDVGSWYEEFLIEYGCQYTDIPAPILAFLHELGHNQTIDTFDHDDLVFYNFLKTLLDYEDKREGIRSYWNIEDELTANKWVVNFINESIQEVVELFEIFEKYWENMFREDLSLLYKVDVLGEKL